MINNDAAMQANLARLRPQFCASSERAVARIQQLLLAQPSEYAALRRTVHQLAGTARSLGFLAVSNTARALLRELSPHPAYGANETTLALFGALQQAVNEMEHTQPNWEALLEDHEFALPPPRAAVRLDGMAILIVEDASELHLQLTAGLTHAGARHVHCCATLFQAQQLLARGAAAFDVAVIDHVLGLRTGSMLASWMQAQAHLQQTWRISYSESSPDVVAGPAGLFHRIWPKGSLDALVYAIAQLSGQTPPTDNSV